MLVSWISGFSRSVRDGLGQGLRSHLLHGSVFRSLVFRGGVITVRRCLDIYWGRDFEGDVILGYRVDAACMEGAGLIEVGKSDIGPGGLGGEGLHLPRVLIRPARNTRGVRWGVCGGFAVVLTLAILQYSFNQGRLILFPTFDDCGYMADGLMRLQTWYDWGLGGVASTYRSVPPHSPYSTVMATIGFALFGYHDWAPYVMNSLLALGYFLLAERLLRGAALWQKVVCLIFVASVPFVGMAVHEFRPDYATALFTTAGVCAMFWGPFTTANRRRHVLAGVLFGCAMLAKPPLCLQTLILGVAALCLATAGDWIVARGRLQRRSIAKAWMTVLLPFLLIPLPHYLYDHHHIFSYIYEAEFGSIKESYEKKGTIGYQFQYYLSGVGGRIMLGRHFWLLLALLASCGAAVGFIRRRADVVRSAGVVMIVLLAYAIVVANHLKTESFGLTFDTLLAFAVVFLIGRLLVVERARRWRIPWVSIVVVLAALQGMYFFQWPTRVGNYYARWIQNRRDIVDGIFNSVVAHSTFAGWDGAPPPDPSIPVSEKVAAHNPKVVFCGVGDVNDQVLTYMALKKRIPLTFYFNQWAPTPEAIIADFDSADFLVACESKSGIVADFLPFSPWQDQLLAAARGRPEFKTIGKFTFERTGRSLYLFERVALSRIESTTQPALPSLNDPAVFAGFTAIEGLGEVEGPFPDDKLGLVRWGLGPVTKLSVTAPAPGDYTVHWIARSDFQGQLVTIRVDGVAIVQADIPGSLQDFSQCTIPLILDRGKHQIELCYSKWHTPESRPRPMAVLFQMLQVKHKP